MHFWISKRTLDSLKNVSNEFRRKPSLGAPASSAAIILESSTPKIPFMKYLDNEEQKGAEQARFCCSDKVVCFDVSPKIDHVVCEYSDATIHLWSLQTGSKKWVRPILANKEFFSSDGYPADTAYRRVG